MIRINLQRETRTCSVSTCRATYRCNRTRSSRRCPSCHAEHTRGYYNTEEQIEKRKRYNASRWRSDPTYREEAKLRARVSLRLKKYGLTTIEYLRMLEAQNGCCAICKRAAPPDRDLSIDHDHTTGKIRGLLCILCNSLIGFARESPEVLTTAITYLSIKI